MSDYLPHREGDLDRWAATFTGFLVAEPTQYGLTAGQATQMETLFTTWHDAYMITQNNNTRTPSAIQTKNDAKQAMVDGEGGIRQLVKIIQAYPGTTNAMRVDLAINVPDVEPTPVPPPNTAPLLQAASLDGRVLTLKLRDSKDENSRAKPEGVAGATVLMFVGEEAPLDPAQWIFLTNTSKTTVTIDFPPSVPAGAKVWLAGFWRNRRDESGPVSTLINIRLGDTMAAAA